MSPYTHIHTHSVQDFCRRVACEVHVRSIVLEQKDGTEVERYKAWACSQQVNDVYQRYTGYLTHYCDVTNDEVKSRIQALQL